MFVLQRENCALRQQLRVSGGERMKVERQEGEKGGQWEREEGGQGEEGRQQDEEARKRPLQVCNVNHIHNCSSHVIILDMSLITKPMHL